MAIFLRSVFYGETVPDTNGTAVVSLCLMVVYPRAIRWRNAGRERVISG